MKTLPFFTQRSTTSLLLAPLLLVAGACGEENDHSTSDSCTPSCSQQEQCILGTCETPSAATGGLSAGSGGAHSGGNDQASSGGDSNASGDSGGAFTGMSGGAASGGASNAGGSTGDTGGQTGTGGSSSSDLAAQFPCDGKTSGYNATAIKEGETWTVKNGSTTAYSGADMAAALGAAYGSLNANRTTKESILVQGSGDISGAAQIKMPSLLVLNICGTINVTNDVTGSDRSPLYARSRSDIDIPHAQITGAAQYGMFFRDVSRLHLGDIRINGTGGLGIRIDSNGSNDRNNAVDITLDQVHVENTGGHGVEFYGVDGIKIGLVTARNTGDCGLILNRSINADIGLVDAYNAAHIGTGYAAFRTANNNGKYDDGSYPTNIILHELRATGMDAGRGFFCVTQSGGVLIQKFNVDNVGGDPAMFIENCHNVQLGSASTASLLNGGRAYIGHNAENGVAASDIAFQNITLQGGASIEQNNATCGNNVVATAVTGGTVNLCN